MEGLTVCSDISQRAVTHGFKGQQETQHTLDLCALCAHHTVHTDPSDHSLCIYYHCGRSTLSKTCFWQKHCRGLIFHVQGVSISLTAFCSSLRCQSQKEDQSRKRCSPKQMAQFLTFLSPVARSPSTANTKFLESST